MPDRIGMAPTLKPNWMDRAIGAVAPTWHLKRVRARMASDLVLRHYEGASVGRRTQGWVRSSSDANAATAPFTARLRDAARDLVRNNPHAEAALSTIVDHTVGWGIVANSDDANARVQAAWKAWAETTACDADGRTDFAGLQKLVMRAVAESGEVLVRRRFRLPSDGLPIPLQLQVIEADFLDTTKHGITLPNGGRIVYGIEFDPLGRRAAYYLFPEHPGNNAFPTATSTRVPAEAIQHVFKPTRPGSARGATWFAPVLLRFKDFDEYEDATLMKQKIAACLAVITSDVDGTGAPLGTADDTATPALDMLEPGAIINATAGKNIEVVQPPSVADYPEYARVSLRAIAAGLGVTYEDLTGDYQNLPFSAARMSRIRHWAHVEDWRWRLLIPQFCDPVWNWAMQGATVMGLVGSQTPTVTWTPPPMPMIEPDKEALAYMRNIRTGIQTLSDALRERGLDPKKHLQEYAADSALLDDLGLKLDSDPRYLTQNGQMQGSAAASGSAASAAADGNTPSDGGNAGD
jgi:lambda family phage portal protein